MLDDVKEFGVDLGKRCVEHLGPLRANVTTVRQVGLPARQAVSCRSWHCYSALLTSWQHSVAGQETAGGVAESSELCGRLLAVNHAL